MDVADYGFPREERPPSDFGDVEFARDEPPPYARRNSAIKWIVTAALMVLALAGTAWLYLNWRPAQTAQPQASRADETQPPASAARPLGGRGTAVDLPPLAETDPLVRQMVRALSGQPLVLRWLATDNLLRGFTVGVENIANGATPARRLSVLRPTGSFRAIDDEDSYLIDPRTYERYAPLAAAVGSLDAEGVAELYSTLKPRIEDAYAELGTQRSFDVALEEAIVAMLRTPVLEGQVSLVPKGGVFAFENPRLERLTAAQKQLLRTGPRHGRLIQDKLREIALALGIRAERLP